jgi:hypothetical protein
MSAHQTLSKKSEEENGLNACSDEAIVEEERRQKASGRCAVVGVDNDAAPLQGGAVRRRGDGAIDRQVGLLYHQRSRFDLRRDLRRDWSHTKKKDTMK